MAEAKGYGDPRGYNVPLGTETYVSPSNGIVPNSALPLIVRRGDETVGLTPEARSPCQADGLCTLRKWLITEAKAT